MSKPYKYDPETETVSNGESILHVVEIVDMPEWEGKDLIEDIDFEVDLHPDNHNIGVAIPIKRPPLSFTRYNYINGCQQTRATKKQTA